MKIEMDDDASQFESSSLQKSSQVLLSQRDEAAFRLGVISESLA